MRLITSKDIIGQVARWAVQQHPYHAPEGLFELCALVDKLAEQQFDENLPGLPMRWFDDSRAISQWLHAALDGNPIMLAWNTPRSGHTHSIMFSSRYDHPKPEHDFIDLDALIMNVSRECWRDSKEFDRDPSKRGPVHDDDDELALTKGERE